MQVNPVRTEELTNLPDGGKDENVKLSPPRLVRKCLTSYALHFADFKYFDT